MDHCDVPNEKSPPPANEYIDKLTLELLLNKNHYSKYLSKTDPKKYDELKEYKSKLRKYSVDAIDITSQLIENPNMLFNGDVEDAFHNYMKSIFKYFEMKDIEKANEYNNDEDVLFGNMDESQEKQNEPVETASTVKSYWGKERVVKQSPNISNADMSMFVRHRR
jgi:FtsZ-interacting cell division protein YlmF